MTAKEFFYCQKSYLDHQEYLRIQSWSQTRWQTTVLVNLKLKKEDQIEPTDFFQFDFEKEEEIEKVEVPIEVQNKLIAEWTAQEKAKHKTQK